MGRRGKASHMTFPRAYQLPGYAPFTKEGPKELSDNNTTADFRAVAAAFHSEFFGEHPDTEVFANVVKCLLTKIWDERQTRRGQQYRFQVFLRNNQEEKSQQLFDRIDQDYRRAYQKYIDPAGSDSLDSRVFAAERVKTVVKALQGMSLTRGAALHGDVIGAFFEEILRAGFKQDKGMYFTHANLVWFMLEAIDLDELTVRTWERSTHPENRMPYVIDPACGSGTFLLRAMQIMTRAIRSRSDELVADDDSSDFFARHLSEQRPNAWAESFIYGSDPKFVMAITAKVNMVLHGDGSAHIFKWDSLKPLSTSIDRRIQPRPTQQRSIRAATYGREVSEGFDAVVSNPPFGITLAPETARALTKTYTLPKSSPSESLFLERWFQLLKPKGRLAVVVPESLLNTADAVEARMLLYRMFWIRGIVSLPRNLFIETPTLTSLLFAQRKTGQEIERWDAEWAKQEAEVQAQVAAGRIVVRTARRETGTPARLQEQFIRVLSPIVDEDTAVLVQRKGLLRARLPDSVKNMTDGIDHYGKLLQTAGFRVLCRNEVFRRVVESLNYDYPVYAVDEVGYKLSKRGERARPNQLMRLRSRGSGSSIPNLHRADGAVEVIIDSGDPAVILDYIRRDVRWD
jgi:type I restriction enzyme M protein